MRTELHPAAERELLEAAAFYRKSSARVAAQFVDEFIRARTLLADHPEAGERTGTRARRYVMNRFPYSLVYEVRNGHVLVVAVAHHRRRPSYWRRRLPADRSR